MPQNQIKENGAIEGEIAQARNGQLIKREVSITSGPLPHPEILKMYNDLIPGAAERIFVMAEAQSSHRLSLEKKVIYSSADDSRLGLIFAFILGIIALASSTYLISTGKQVSGGIIGGVYLISIVSAFIKGSKNTKEDLQSNKQDRKLESEIKNK